MFALLRWVIIAFLVIGLPVFVYFGFLADEPAFEVEYDVELGRQHAASIEADTTMVLLDKEEYLACDAWSGRVAGVQKPTIPALNGDARVPARVTV